MGAGAGAYAGASVGAYADTGAAVGAVTGRAGDIGAERGDSDGEYAEPIEDPNGLGPDRLLLLDGYII